MRKGKFGKRSWIIEKFAENDEEIYRHWLKVCEANLSEVTFRNYKNVTLRFLKWLHNRGKKLIDLTSEDLDEYKIYLRKHRNLKRSSVSSELFIIARFLRFIGLVDKKGLQIDVERIRKDYGRLRREVISEEELLKFIKYSRCSRDRALFALMWETGLRSKEIRALNWEDVDWNRKVIKVRERKGGLSDVVPFGDYSMKYLVEWFNEYKAWVGSEPTDDSPLFVTMRQGRPRKERLSACGLWQIVQSTGRRAGIDEEKCHPHAFRHSMATIALARGLNLRQVQAMLGHLNLRSTEVYAHLVESDYFKAYAKAFRRRSLKEEELMEEKKPEEWERCPQCGGIRLPHMLVCPCGYQFRKTKVDEQLEKLNNDIAELKLLVMQMKLELDMQKMETLAEYIMQNRPTDGELQEFMRRRGIGKEILEKLQSYEGTELIGILVKKDGEHWIGLPSELVVKKRAVQ